MAKDIQPKISTSWPEGIAVVLSIVALLVSGYSLIEAQRQHQDERATELLDQIYEDWNEMSSADRWEVSHLVEVPESYERIRNVLRAYASALPIQEQRRLYIVERTTAQQIFNSFELTLNQWRRAVAIDDEDRRAMLDQEIDYYIDVALRNPRLLWFWSLDGGELELQMDPPTVKFYHERVLGNTDNPVTVEPDPDGILPGFNGLAWADGDDVN